MILHFSCFATANRGQIDAKERESKAKMTDFTQFADLSRRSLLGID